MSADREMSSKIKLGIAHCLLGEKVRYDGQHKRDPFLVETLGRFVEWVPVCPEVECGLPVPREAMRLIGDPGNPRLVTRNTNIDHTQRMLSWSANKIEELRRRQICGYVFKSKSPSSGLWRVKVYVADGMPVKSGTGLFARQILLHFPLLPVEDEGRLHDPRLRENFIERVFVYKRWQDFISEDGSMKGFVEFHSRHKLLLMAHSPAHLRRLGAIAAQTEKMSRKKRHAAYIEIMTEALILQATVKKNTNVLQHIAGYFKRDITADEKREMGEVIDDYHRSLIPLIVPVTLMRHYARKYDVSWLRQQYYLNPHPAELMLRNHV
jgi:uncharacterized protein YbgA (DUF1722 family)/uncharacterized protein YbbK (DUF523 family)